MTIVTSDVIINELHLDVSEKAQIESLINFAKDYIVSTTDKNRTVDDIVAKTNENIFNQAVRGIVSSLYFGNVEQSGFGIQSMVLLNAIRNMYQGGE
ncbi:phage gp6-like head-tail connector protein [Leuconostoc falkenbergense]|uniref:Phage gp6-like head-tail connector protein n=1 Tax=Leuconostoc falkenbergense TaxID=2766470 RepID=A0ABT7S1P8_9LACO|nr:phage gp6-like head-tail connector protein [Leuconostoc falkenbergense]MDM7647497.1 phage gp6-like head-tail connector protein [Leuconostoc falkenbergense]